MNILIIEDDAAIRQELKLLLENALYQVTVLTEFHHVVEDILQMEPDLILLDVNLPQQSGFEICKSVRKTSDVPIIFLTSRTDSMDELSGMLQGGDDYITKPFEIKEVVARVAVQLRHAVADVPSKSGQAGENQTKAENETEQGDIANTYIAGPAKIEHRQLVLDRISRQLYVADNAVDGITKQEFAILELLMAHPRQVFAKEDIFEYAWDEPYIGETKTLDVHISNIRKKIKKLTDDEYIETVWGIGYKMKE